MAIHVNDPDFQQNSDNYDNLNYAVPYQEFPNETNIRQGIDSYYIRRPLDETQQFIIFNNNKIQIVRGSKTLAEQELDGIFDIANSYVCQNVLLNKVLPYNSNDELLFVDADILYDFKSQLNIVPVENMTEELNFLTLGGISYAPIKNINIIADYTSIKEQENVSHLIFFIRIKGVWICAKKYFMFSSNEDLSDTVIINPLSEPLRFKIILS